MSCKEDKELFSMLNEDLERDRGDLESKVFEYFYESLKGFLLQQGSYSKAGEWKKGMNTYLSDKDFTGNLRGSKHLKFFGSLGITLNDLEEALKYNGMKPRLREYVESILTNPEFSLKENLINDGVIDGMNKFVEGVIFNDDEEVSEEDIRNAKEEVVQAALNSDEINLDSVGDEDLDALMGKLIRVDEKVKAILENKKGSTEEELVEAISKYTGMHLDESKEVLDYYRD